MSISDCNCLLLEFVIMFYENSIDVLCLYTSVLLRSGTCFLSLTPSVQCANQLYKRMGEGLIFSFIAQGFSDTLESGTISSSILFTSCEREESLLVLLPTYFHSLGINVPQLLSMLSKFPMLSYYNVWSGETFKL